ncbi:MAG: DEAD/DEAH box helicase [Candidatus Hydrogenedentes bacterium]|nr:DEAD/DEAH box helicase [Candidatus Hydrogenedentota bacterium]
MSFGDLSIDPRFLKVLNTQKITEPTPVQAQTIPPALEGRDVLGIAQTGTGKTLAFSLPALTRLAQSNVRGTRMLVLTPTRELAQQVNSVIERFGRVAGLQSACVYGGVGMEPQVHALRRGTTVIVATPGRLIDHMERGNVRFDKLSVLVLDEADRMLDMGFLPAIQRIMSAVPKERQTLLFSATLPDEIKGLAADLQHDPVRITIGAIAKPADAVRQGIYTVVSSGKMDLLAKILREPEVRSALVFVRTKHSTDKVAKQLYLEGFRAQAIHGGRSQRQRQQAIDGFRRGRYTVLVATDVAARGLDVQGITHVVNFDIPNCHDDYVHRIGRTARASAEGDAITFVCPEDHMTLGSIERELGKSIPRTDWEGAVHVPTREEIAARNAQRRSPRHGGGYRGGSSGRPRNNGRPQNGGGGRYGRNASANRGKQGQSRPAR